MFKLLAGFRNRVVITQTQLNRRLCQNDQSQPRPQATTVRVRFAPSPTGFSF